MRGTLTGFQGRYEEWGKGGTIPRAPNHYGGAKPLRGRRMTAEGTEKSQQYLKYSTFFNTVHLLRKDIVFEHGDDKLASARVPPDLDTPLQAAPTNLIYFYNELIGDYLVSIPVHSLHNIKV